ncbi:MAG: zf-HC2 domain-containing protein [Anaerolineales bacterium]|nr:zf-HC2 domain-containing protein [Anaerolineales bacterium]
MNHKPYQEWMQAVLDGALAPGERRQLEDHLAGCGECQSAWATLNEVQRLFKAGPLVAPRAGFTGRFQARLAQRRSRPRLVWGALALGLAAVATAALVVPPGLGLIYAALRAAQQPATALAITASLQALVATIDTVGGALWIAARAVVEPAVANPLAWPLALAALGLTGVWVYVMRNLVPEGRTR